MTEDEIVGWHHGLNGHEFEQALGVGHRQGSLACYSPWDHGIAKSQTGLSDFIELKAHKPPESGFPSLPHVPSLSSLTEADTSELLILPMYLSTYQSESPVALIFLCPIPH